MSPCVIYMITACQHPVSTKQRWQMMLMAPLWKCSWAIGKRWLTWTTNTDNNKFVSLLLSRSPSTWIRCGLEKIMLSNTWVKCRHSTKRLIRNWMTWVENILTAWGFDSWSISLCVKVVIRPSIGWLFVGTNSYRLASGSPKTHHPNIPDTPRVPVVLWYSICARELFSYLVTNCLKGPRIQSNLHSGSL